jgi:hypothetical protein
MAILGHFNAVSPGAFGGLEKPSAGNRPYLLRSVCSRSSFTGFGFVRSGDGGLFRFPVWVGIDGVVDMTVTVFSDVRLACVRS